MFPMHFDRLGNRVRDTKGSGTDSDSSPCSRNALRSDSEVNNNLTAEIIQQPAYDSSVGSVPRFFEEFSSSGKRENVAGDSKGFIGRSKGRQNGGNKTKEMLRQEYETKSEKLYIGEHSVGMSPSLQLKRLKNTENPVSACFDSNLLDRNIPMYRFCNSSVNKRLPFLMLGKNERKELARNNLGESPMYHIRVDKSAVQSQELPTSSTKPTQKAAAKPKQENFQTNLIRNDTQNKIKRGRPSSPERTRMNNAKIGDRTLPDDTLNLETSSLADNERKNSTPPTSVELGAEKQGRHNDTLSANRKRETNSDNILQSLRRQVLNENATSICETSKSNADCKESIMNITLLSFGIQNKTSAASLDPGFLVGNSKRMVLSDDVLRPEIDRLLSQLTEYMAHQQEGDGVGQVGSPHPHEIQTHQTNKKVTEKVEKELSSANYHQGFQVYRVQDSQPRSKPSCGCSEKSNDAGSDCGSPVSLSESDASEKSVLRSRGSPRTDKRSPDRRGALRQGSFYSDSKEIGVVNYEQERPKRARATRDGGRRRERHDVGKERTRFKNDPTSYPVEAVNANDDRIKMAERRRYAIRSSEPHPRETRTEDGYRSVHANFDLTSSHGKDHRRYSYEKDDDDDRTSKRSPSRPDASARDVADETASRRRANNERSDRDGRRRSTSTPQDGRGRGETNRHRGSVSDEDSPPSVEEVVVRRYQSGRQSARDKVDEPRSERSCQQRQAHRVDKRTSPDDSKRFKDDAMKVSGRRWQVLEERGSNESVCAERRASNGHGRASVDTRGSPEGRTDRDRYRRVSNTTSNEHKEIRRDVVGRARSVTRFEPDDLGSEDSADDARPRTCSHRGQDCESYRSRLNSVEYDSTERTRRKDSYDQRYARHEGHSKGDPRRDRRRSAHFEDDVDLPDSRRCSVDSTDSVRPRHRREFRRTSADLDRMDRTERKGDAFERRPTLDSEPIDAPSSRLTEGTSRRASEQPKEATQKISPVEKSFKPTGPGRDSIETIPPEKTISKTKQILENAYRFGKHPIQAIKTRRREAMAVKLDGALKSGDKAKDSEIKKKNKAAGSITVDNYRAISVQTSPVSNSKHRRSVNGSYHRTSLRRGETLRLPSSDVIVNRSVLDSAPSRYGAYTRNPIDARKTMICGDDDGVIDIRDKKLQKCYCGQANKKNANAIEGFELLCACDANQCHCSPGNKPEARTTSVPKQKCPTTSSTDPRSSFSPNRPCERRKGDGADAVILVRSGKYLEVDVSGDKQGRRTCGSRAEDASGHHRDNGRHADSGGHRSGRHRDSLGSNSSDMAAYRQGSSNSMMGFDRDRGLVDKRYNIAPSKRGGDAAGKQGGKDGYYDADDRYAKALGRYGKSRSGRGGEEGMEEDGDPGNFRGGRDGKSRSGRGGKEDDARNSREGRDGKSRSGKGGENDDIRDSRRDKDGKSRSGKGRDDDPRNSKGGRGGKSGSRKDGEEGAMNVKGGRDGKSRGGKGGVDDTRNSKGGRGGKSRSGMDGEDEDIVNDKGGKDGRSRRGKVGDDDLKTSKELRGGKSGSGKDGDDAKNKKGMKSKSGSEKSSSDTENEKLKKGKRGKKLDNLEKGNQADLKTAEKEKIDSGKGPDAAKGKKKAKLQKETPKQRAKRLRKKDDHQEGGIYHGLVLHSSEDDPSVVMRRGYRS